MSGIYIPGLQMPKTGQYVLVVDNSEKDHPYIAIGQGADGIISTYYSGVPIPVPDHGVLIDADEFYKDINESVLLTEGFKDTFNLWFEEQPIVIPADPVDKEAN